jgi:hypothetical protein
MKKIVTLIGITSLLFMGCDKVLIPQQQHTVTALTNDTVRKILIEDFTGHTCQNCPSAARIIDSLESIFPGQIIPVALHIDFWALPCDSNPQYPPAGALPGTFQEDFRALPEDGDYDAIWGSNSFPLPIGFVNRIPYPALSVLPTETAQWGSAAAALLADSMTAYIKINPTYNSSTHVLNVNVSGLFMCDTTGTYNITLYLVEDDLHGSQSDNTLPGGIDNNYTFDHVFRGCINTPGTIGGQLAASGTIHRGDPINYTMAIPYTVNSAFNPSNCRIVAFLYNTADYGVLQAAMCDLQ